jgi:hypothetical protein
MTPSASSVLEKSVLVEDSDVIDDMLVDVLLDAIVGKRICVGSKNLLDNKNDLVCLFDCCSRQAHHSDQVSRGLFTQVGNIVKVGE